MTTRSDYGFDPTAIIIQKHGHRLHELEPLLGGETFVIRDNPDVPPTLAQGLLPKLIDLGALAIAERHRDRGSRYCRYRWTEGVRSGIRAYLDDRDQLPCEHRWHIYNPPDMPDDMVGCKFCDATHTKEAVRAVKDGGGGEA